jgi:hypothetical protein
MLDMTPSGFADPAARDISRGKDRRKEMPASRRKAPIAAIRVVFDYRPDISGIITDKATQIR